MKSSHSEVTHPYPELRSSTATVLLLIIAGLLALVWVLVRFGLTQFSWESFSLAYFYLAWGMLLSAALIDLLGRTVRFTSAAWQGAAAYAVILGVFAFSSAVAQWLDGWWMGSEWRLDRSRLLSDVLIVAVLGGIAVRYIYLSQQLRRQQQAELQARIEGLQARMRPHFLFNSMNSIASLIDIDPVAAERAVEDLASLFRSTLGDYRTETTLQEERQLCDCYLRIEQLRLGDRLRIVWELEGLPDSLKLPPLSLQPLIENAIHHGIQQLPEGGEVTIRGRQRGAQVELEVCNPVADTATVGGDRHDGNHVAQMTLRHRLQALYGERAELICESRNGYHCAVMRYTPNDGCFRD